MKPLAILIFLLICGRAFAQNFLNAITQRAKVTTAPYTSNTNNNEQLRRWFINSDKQPKLHGIDSDLLVQALKKRS